VKKSLERRGKKSSTELALKTRGGEVRKKKLSNIKVLRDWNPLRKVNWIY
jgi:hypothetical protein